MGRELAEGKLHTVERQAALAKTFAEDLRKAFAEAEDHLHTLDAENEDLQAQLFALRRQQQDRFGRPDRGFQGDGCLVTKSADLAPRCRLICFPSPKQSFTQTAGDGPSWLYVCSVDDGFTVQM